MSSSSRFWQLDMLRGLAVVGMVVYHAAFLLLYFWGWDLPILHGPWRWLARASAITFLMVVGCSLWLKAQTQSSQMSWFERWRKFWPRIEKIAAGALVITFFTAKFTNDPVLFGILHHIAVSSLCLSLIIIILPQKRWWWLALAIIFWGSGLILTQYRASFEWLVWLGLPPRNFHSLDYFPILPWAGWSALGIWGIRALQAEPVWNRWKQFPPPLALQPFLLLGQHSFWIYILHIPALWIVFWILHTALVFVW